MPLPPGLGKGNLLPFFQEHELDGLMEGCECVEGDCCIDTGVGGFVVGVIVGGHGGVPILITGTGTVGVGLGGGLHRAEEDQPVGGVFLAEGVCLCGSLEEGGCRRGGEGESVTSGLVS